ncbi:tetratricopeptide repeat protein [Microbulbifer hainanensis]|uniref:hypothetical protein n=1 Tax=Microbulbifer hainanensis TaxID=2735675 RepID=UPI001867D0C4|nr:hypothetical protein [Microbulbifer hainanensis]
MKNSKPLLFSVVLACALPITTMAAAPAPAVEQAFNQMDISELEDLGTTGTDPYLRAYTSYRLAIARHLTQHADAGAALDQAMQELEQLHGLESNSDAAALLSMIYGYQIALAPLNAVRYGPKNRKMTDLALTLDADNPRAKLAEGISLYHRPSVFGGSKQKALKAFARAATLYRNGRGGATADWGLAEALVWQGLAAQELGRDDEARQLWRDALVARPDFHWASNLLEAEK